LTNFTMNKKNQENELVKIGKADTPLIRTVRDAMFLVKLLLVVLAVGYFFSGITLIEPDQTAVIYRLGRIAGSTPSEKIHEPGWLFALPKPFDYVVRIPSGRILQLRIRELAAISSPETASATIDPVKEGYCISGDLNVFQVSMDVKFQILDSLAALLSFEGNGQNLFAAVNDIVVSEFVKVSAGYLIDDVLTEAKEAMAAEVKARAEAKLAKLNAGINLISIEISEVLPPSRLASDFEDVQTAFIDSEHFVSRAQSMRSSTLPAAVSKAEETINEAKSYSEQVIAKAVADTESFKKLLEVYKSDPDEIKMQMRSDTFSKMFKNMGGLVLAPSEKDFKSGMTLLLNGNLGGVSGNSIYTTLYSESDEQYGYGNPLDEY